MKCVENCRRKTSTVVAFSVALSLGLLWGNTFHAKAQTNENLEGVFATPLDSDQDGWSDLEEINMGTDPLDPLDPWDSDLDGLPDFLEFELLTDPLDPLDPPIGKSVSSFSSRSSVSSVRSRSLAATDNSSSNLFPAWSYSGSFNITHANAWYGQSINYAQATSGWSTGWSVVNGSQMEIWNGPDGQWIELEATPASDGVSYSFPATTVWQQTIYRLSWLDLPRYGESTVNGNDYDVIVTINGKEMDRKVISSDVIGTSVSTAPTPSERVFDFKISKELLDSVVQTNGESATITISFIPRSNNTLGALIKPSSLSLIPLGAGKNTDVESDCDCDCGCDMASEAKNGSIDFTQPFGRTIAAEGFRPGKLRIKENLPSNRMLSPDCLIYQHLSTRRVLAAKSSTQSATIMDEEGFVSSFTNQVPNSLNAWRSSQIQVASDGSVTEKLADRTEIHYNVDGEVTSVTSSDGITLTVAQMGIEVIRDENRAIRQIWSATDGLLNVTVSNDSSFVISWYKPANVGSKDETTGLYTFSGSAIKTYTCGSANDDDTAFQISEQRGSTFQFNYLWSYDALTETWQFARGIGSDQILSVKSETEQNDGTILSAETFTYQQQQHHTTQTIDPVNGNRYIGSQVGGVTQSASLRVTSGNGLGKTASTTDRHGHTQSYTYDAYGRTLSVSGTGFGDLPEQTTYTYQAPTTGSWIDHRPITITQKLNGQTLSTSTYTYVDDITNGRSEIMTVTAAGQSQTSSTLYYPVDNTAQSGRVKLQISHDGTATHYAYSGASLPTTVTSATDLSRTETITTGVATNQTFSVVDGKSTRVINTYNSLGNLTRTETYVHTGSTFDLVQWENRTYAPTHKVIATTNSTGKTTSADYICTGPVFEIDADGIRTDYVYDSTKRLVSQTRHSPNGDITTSYTYDAQGNQISTTVSGGVLSQTTTQRYDQEGRLSTTIDARGLTTSYTYSADGLTTTQTLPNGGTVITVRNQDGQVISVSGTATVAQYTSYSLVNLLKCTETRLGSTNSKRFSRRYLNGLGQQVKTETSAFNETLLTQEQIYNNKGQLSQTTATGLPLTQYEYDVLGQLSKTTTTAGGVSRVRQNNTWFSKDTDGIIWQQQSTIVSSSDSSLSSLSTFQKQRLSDLSNSLESQVYNYDVRGKWSCQTQSYDALTQVHTLTQTHQGLSQSAITRSRDGQVQSQSDFAGVTTTFGYDAFGRQISQTDGRNLTSTTTYNALGQISQTTDSAGHHTNYTYSTLSGEVIGVSYTSTQADQTTQTHTITYAYDLKGQKTLEDGTGTYPLSWSYDALGQLSTHTTYRNGIAIGGGDTTLYQYDEASGLLTAKTDATGKTTSYTYDTQGRLLTRTWARGITTSYGYDAWGQLTSTTYSDTTPSVAISYNALGQLVSTSDVSGTTTRTYNAYQENISETNSLLGTTLVRNYDSFGRSSSKALKKNGENLILFGQSYHNQTGRIDSASFGPIVFNYDYLAGTHLISELNYLNQAFKKVITYANNRNLPTEIAYQKADGTLLAKRNYTFNEIGNVTARSQTRGSNTARNDQFTYNTRSELTAATLGTDQYDYAFDTIGNRTSAEELANEVAYTSNALNQYTAVTPTGGTTKLPSAEDILDNHVSQAVIGAYLVPKTNNSTQEQLFLPTFDNDGNQTTIKTSTGIWTVSYNAENRPVLFTHATLGIQLHCSYDAQGRRYEKKITYSDGTVIYCKRFAYDGFLQIAEFLVTETEGVETHSLETITFWDPTEPTATRPLAQADYSATTPSVYFYTHDLTKNICELIDDNLNIVATYDYAPFGAITIAGTNITNRFMFSSEFYDQETALVYYNYRHYNPTDGRWINRDPIEEQGGYNLYAMVANNPANAWDYLGEKSKKINISLLWGHNNQVEKVMDKNNAKRTPSMMSGIGCFVPHSYSKNPIANVPDTKDDFIGISPNVLKETGNAGYNKIIKEASGQRIITKHTAAKAFAYLLADAWYATMEASLKFAKAHSVSEKNFIIEVKFLCPGEKEKDTKKRRDSSVLHQRLALVDSLNKQDIKKIVGNHTLFIEYHNKKSVKIGNIPKIPSCNTRFSFLICCPVANYKIR